MIEFDPIVAAEHVQRFMDDAVIQQIFRERKLLYFEQWLAAETPSDRERIFAECRAFASLSTALTAVVNAGLQARAQPDLENRAQ